MRKNLRGLFALLVCFLFSGITTSAQNFLKSPLTTQSVAPKGVSASTMTAQQQVVKGNLSKSPRSSRLYFPGGQSTSQGSGFSHSYARTTACGADTVEYPLFKATNVIAGQVLGGVKLGQWYPAPQSITVSGFSFIAWVDSATNQTVDLICEIYNAGLDSLPTGAPLRIDTITVDSNFFNGNLAALEKHATFNTPVTVNGPYVISVSTTSLIPVAIGVNDYTGFPPDGLQEWLAMVFLPIPPPGTWEHSYNVTLGGNILDGDVLLYPHVTYDLTADFSPKPATGCMNVPRLFTNTSSPILESRFYNRAAAFNLLNQSYTWDYGDGSPLDNVVDGLHTYTMMGTYTVSLFDTLFGWRNFCADSTSTTLTVGAGTAVNAGFGWSATGLNATFSDSSTGSPTSWSWDFGDGNTSTQQNPTHTYAANGIYTVCLTASNNCGPSTVCQQILIGTPPPSSCDTIGNITGTAILYTNTTGGYVSGHNPFLDSVKAEKFTNSGTVGIGEALFWFGHKESPTPNTSKVIATIWDATGTGGSPGAVIASRDLFYNQIDTAGANLTSVVFNPPVQITGDFFIGIQLQYAAGDTVGLITNVDRQTIPATAWELQSNNAWLPYDNGASWGLEVSNAIWYVETVAPGFTFTTAGNTATFTDASVGANTWLWDFGDGNTSTAQNPTHTYAAAGTYTVCQIVLNGACRDSICQTVNLGCVSPVAAFNSNPSALTVAFTDASQNVPTSWTWDFGDGNSSTQQNPNHTYAAAGNYTVCLIASNGCGSDTICQVVSVICSPPVANFGFSTNNLTVTFSDSSTGGVTSWTWDFGDGNSSTQQNPTHTYAMAGTYTVCLTDSSPCGTNTICKTVTVTCPLPVAAFGDSINNLTVIFSDSSTGNPTNWSWDFGDGNTSTQQNPTHTYSASGFYTVCLTVTNSCGTDSICRVISVGCPVPVPNYSFITTNLTVAFTDLSIGNPTSWTWDFGDGGTSILQNPTYTYAVADTYTVCLIATNACGSDTICTQVITGCNTPLAGFRDSTNSPSLTVFFTDTSQFTPTSWLWDFGDGNTDTVQNPIHAYAMEGTYFVCLTVTNPCGTNTFCDSVTVVCPRPMPDFAFTTNLLSVSFTDGTVGSVNNYFWSFGDGDTSIVQNPSHTYANAGTYLVCLETTNDCGTDSICKFVTVSCPNPAASFTSSVTGFVSQFTDQTSGGAIAWSWDFGDGNTSTLQNPNHTYSSVGTYIVCLTATNSCGTDVFCDSVTIACPGPSTNFTFTQTNLSFNFQDQTTNNPFAWLWDFGDGTTSTQQNPTKVYSNIGTYNVCLTAINTCDTMTFCRSVTATCPAPNASFSFSSTNLTVSFFDQTTGGVSNWFWDFGDGNTSFAPSPVHSYTSPGTYTVCLIALNGCGPDTTCQTINVSCPPPTPSFQFLTTGNVVDFTDNSTGGATSWFWDFGDGNTSSLQNPTHTYSNTGTYNVCLVSSSQCGSDTICQNVIITCVPPTAAFNFGVSNDSVVTFLDNSSSNSITWAWTFGDGATSNIQSPTHVYKAPGTYQVCLIVTNTCGIDTFCNTVTITCQNPTAGFTVSVTNSIASFADVSLLADNYSWDFGDGTTSNQQNPSHVFQKSGTYKVCLTVSNFCGTNTSCQNLIITCRPPKPSFIYVNGTGVVNFQDLSANQPTSWFWDFGDGNTDTVQNPSHGYRFVGSFWVCLRTTNACGTEDTCGFVTVSTIGIESGLDASSVTVYPNPSDGLFNLEGLLYKPVDLRLRVLDLPGREVYVRETGVQSGTFREILDLRMLSKGVYALEIIAGDQRLVRKLVIE